MNYLNEVLLDSSRNSKKANFLVDHTSLDVGTEAEWSVSQYTLRGGLQEGVDVVKIHNGKLCFSILPTRGMGIWKADMGKLRLGWDSPVQDPVHPAFINSTERGGLGWLKGFNEWIVRCGLNSIGAPGKDTIIDNQGNPSDVELTLHGSIANTPARKVSLEVTDSEIILRGEVDETILFGPALRLNTEVRTSFGSQSLTINDTVTNIGSNPVEHELLYHVNFGIPLLGKGSRLIAPYKQLAPRDNRAADGVDEFEQFSEPTNGFIEQVYFFELAQHNESKDTVVMMCNAAKDLAAVLRFKLNELPCFTLWKNTGATADGYVAGLEPSTAYPNTREYERKKGRVLVLQGGESRNTTLKVKALDSNESIKQVEDEIAHIQGMYEHTCHASPIDYF